MTGTGRINIEVRPPKDANGLQGTDMSTLWLSWRFHSDDPAHPQPLHVATIELVPQSQKETGVTSGDDAADVAEKIKDAIRKKVSEPQGPRNPQPMSQGEADNCIIEVQRPTQTPGSSTFSSLTIDNVDEIDCACCEPGGQVKTSIDGEEVGTRRDSLVRVVEVELNRKSKDAKPCKVREPADVYPGILAPFGSSMPWDVLGIFPSIVRTLPVGRPAGNPGGEPVGYVQPSVPIAHFRLSFGFQDTALTIRDVWVAFRILNTDPADQLSHMADCLEAAGVRVQVRAGRLAIVSYALGDMPLRAFNFGTNLAAGGFPWHIAIGLWIPDGDPTAPLPERSYSRTESRLRLVDGTFVQTQLEQAVVTHIEPASAPARPAGLSPASAQPRVREVSE